MTRWKVLYCAAFMSGLALMVFEIDIYRVTVINPMLPILTILGVGVITFIFTREHYNWTFGSKGPFIPLMQSVISWGFIACYMFMSANYYLNAQKCKTSIFKIISKGSLPGPRGDRQHGDATVIIDYHGFEKELIFDSSETDRIKSANQVTLAIRSGFLGFDVVDTYDVVETLK